MIAKEERTGTLSIGRRRRFGTGDRIEDPKPHGYDRIVHSIENTREEGERDGFSDSSEYFETGDNHNLSLRLTLHDDFR